MLTCPMTRAGSRAVWKSTSELGYSWGARNLISTQVLQDIHWSFGAVGYFPSYTLGAIMAAQIFAAAEDALPDLSGQIRRGEFAPLREWLRTEIHEVGSTYASPDDLLRAVTGDGIDPAPFLDYLTAKYGALYGL